MSAPPPYLPTPAIPAGMDPAVWRQAVDDLAADGAKIVAEHVAHPGTGIPTPPSGTPLSGFGDASRFNSYVTLLQDLYGLTTDAARATAYLMATDMLPELRDSLAANAEQSQALAQASSANLASWCATNGFPAVADTAAFTAALARGQTAMLHDWQDLTLQTQRGVARAVANGLGLGLHPDEVARQVHAALLETGEATYSRGLLIARTEMADMQAEARLADMAAHGDAFDGWWWRARPDGCPVCQIQHGRRFPADFHMQQHHNCRCVFVSIVSDSKESKVPPGDYIPGEQRPWEDILDPPPPVPKLARRGSKQQRGIPESWRQDLPDDPRDLVTLGPNNGWRDSWRLQKPSGGSGTDGGLPEAPRGWPPATKPADGGLPGKPIGVGLRQPDKPRRAPTYADVKDLVIPEDWSRRDDPQVSSS